jgi:DNA mismatch repair protein MutS2
MNANKSINSSNDKTTVDEIDLHRLTVEEAVPKIDEFLYKCYKAGHYRVWVIHGKGTGVLRQEMRRYLSRHPLVRAQRPADPQRGGAGATQVELID